MPVDFTDMAAAVAREQTIDASVITLLSTLSAEIVDLNSQLTNAGDAAVAQVQAQLASFATSLNSEADNLSAAVTANTPIPPTPVPVGTTPVPGPAAGFSPAVRAAMAAKK